MYEENEAHKTGRKFEQYCSMTARRTYGAENVKNEVGTILDEHQGTDSILRGTRVDWTCNPEKDHTEWIHRYPFLSDRLGTPEAWIVSGVRTSSNHGKFEIPVLIVRLEYDCSYDKAVCQLDWHFKDLYERCWFDYLDWLDAHDLMDVVFPEG